MNILNRMLSNIITDISSGLLTNALITVFNNI